MLMNALQSPPQTSMKWSVHLAKGKDCVSGSDITSVFLYELSVSFPFVLIKLSQSGQLGEIDQTNTYKVRSKKWILTQQVALLKLSELQ